MKLETDRGKTSRRWIWIVAAAAAVILGVVVAFWLFDDESAAPVSDVTLEELSNDVGAFAGEFVTVRGEFAGMEDERAFVLRGEGDEVLVISIDPFNMSVGVGDPVEVTGTVRELSDPEFFNDLDITLRDELSGFEGSAVIVADTVEEI